MKILTLILMTLTASLFAREKLTLEQAVAEALKNNYDIKIARGNAELAENNADKGISGFLPSLDLSGNASLSKSEQTSNSPFSFGNSTTRSWSGQVSLSWTLFDGFQMFTNKERYEELEKLGNSQKRTAVENVIVAVISSYLNLMTQERLLDVAENTLEISAERLRKEEIRNNLGGSSSAGLLNAKVFYNNDKTAKLNQELNVEIARKNLNILLGREPDSPVSAESEIGLMNLKYDESEILRAALENNSQIVSAARNLKLSELNTGLKQSLYMPRLMLNGSYGYSDRTVSSDSPRFNGDVTTQSADGSIGLTLSYNIFNGLSDKTDIQAAKIDKKIKTLQLEKIRSDIAGEVREKYITFKKRVEFVKLEEENLDAARLNMELQKERYENGSAGSLDYRDAQVSYAAAQNRLITSKYQARRSLLEIEKLIGEIAIE